MLDEWKAVLVSEDQLAPVALLHPIKFHLDWKSQVLTSGESHKEEGTEEGGVIHVPDAYSCAVAQSAAHSYLDPGRSQSTQQEDVPVHVLCSSTTITMSATVAMPVQDTFCALDASDASVTVHALRTALASMQQRLAMYSITMDDALFVHLYVPNMDHFGAANQVYAEFLPAVNPPARATVQLATTAATTLVVEIMFSATTCKSGSTENNTKKVLHVQSISEWAPSCIGPYSQAVSYDGLVFFAGQIPLDPPTMRVLDNTNQDVVLATRRCVDSCQAVAIAVKTDLKVASLWWTVYYTRHDDKEAIQSVLLDDFLRDNSTAEEEEGEEEEEMGDDYLLPPPSMARYHGTAGTVRQCTPLITFIELPQLPRAVSVEVQPVAWSFHGLRTLTDDTGTDSESSSGGEDDVIGWVNGLASEEESDHPSTPSSFLITFLYAPRALFRGTAIVHDSSAVGVEHALHRLVALLTEKSALEVAQDVVSIKIYYGPGFMDEDGVVDVVRMSVARILGNPRYACFIPVLSVSSTTTTAALAIELFAKK